VEIKLLVVVDGIEVIHDACRAFCAGLTRDLRDWLSTDWSLDTTPHRHRHRHRHRRRRRASTIFHSTIAKELCDIVGE